jgi:hypothetical protein
MSVEPDSLDTTVEQISPSSRLPLVSFLALQDPTSASLSAARGDSSTAALSFPYAE